MTPINYSEEHTGVCDHSKVCRECGATKCIQNMNFSRLRGYTCKCGAQNWIPYEKPQEKRGDNE